MQVIRLRGLEPQDKYRRETIGRDNRRGDPFRRPVILRNNRADAVRSGDADRSDLTERVAACFRAPSTDSR